MIYIHHFITLIISRIITVVECGLSHDPNNVADEPLVAGSGSIPWWAWVLVTLLGIVIIYFVVYSMCCHSESGEEVQCYLCSKKIGGFNWQNGSHRRVCSDKNVIFLNSLPIPNRIHCPKCGAYLRQWPVKLSSPFHCDGEDCPNGPGTELPNTGLNRFNCFLCNYDLCKSCLQNRALERQKRKIMTPEVTPIDRRYVIDAKETTNLIESKRIEAPPKSLPLIQSNNSNNQQQQQQQTQPQKESQRQISTTNPLEKLNKNIRVIENHRYDIHGNDGDDFKANMIANDDEDDNFSEELGSELMSSDPTTTTITQNVPPSYQDVLNSVPKQTIL